MKFILCLVLLFSNSTFAEEKTGFEDRKKEALSRIEERIQKLQEHKSCISAAADKEAFKACHGKMKEWREDKKDEMRERKEERQKRREERKKGE